MKKINLILTSIFILTLLFISISVSHAQTMERFQPGQVTLTDGNVVEWGYSGPSKNLTLFANKKWAGARPGAKSRLAVALYDKTGNPIATEYSLTVTQDFPSFGTIVFKNVRESDSARIGSFTITIQAVN